MVVEGSRGNDIRLGVCSRWVIMMTGNCNVQTHHLGPGCYVGRENVEKHLPLQSKVLTDADGDAEEYLAACKGWIRRSFCCFG